MFMAMTEVSALKRHLKKTTVNSEVATNYQV